MHELIEDFCVQFADWKSEDEAIFAQRICRRLEKISSALEGLSSRFVDLDLSAKLNQTSEFEDFRQALLTFKHRPVLQEQLARIFEVFSVHLQLRERFGEAAEWALKTEFDQDLKLMMAETCLILRGIS